MRHRIQEALSRLASAPYQMKYIVHGTSEEYVLPEDLIDSASSIIQTTLSSSILRKSLSQSEQQELFALLTRLRELEKKIPFNDESVSNYDLVQNNPFWGEARSRSKEFLEAAGWNLRDWERQNV
jgi:hypothetical protein